LPGRTDLWGRTRVGLKKANKKKGSGYNKLEVLWLRNFRRANPEATSREITDAFNKVFAGRMLPGETQPRPKRSLAAIACVMLRDPEMGGKAPEPKSGPKPGDKRKAEDAGLRTDENEDGEEGDVGDGGDDDGED
jgi:hypothetical protein